MTKDEYRTTKERSDAKDPKLKVNADGLAATFKSFGFRNFIGPGSWVLLPAWFAFPR